MVNKKVRIGAARGKDRISRLPDELIHKILSFLDVKVAVQTSVLSRRWRFVWPTLPFLNFGEYEDCSPHTTYMFIRHVLFNRYHRANVSELNMILSEKESVFEDESDGCLVEKFVEYVISRNVKCLALNLLYDHIPFKLSAFSSKSLKKLALRVKLEEDYCSRDLPDFPVLTTLHLVGFRDDLFRIALQDSLFKCFPALTSLTLQEFDLSHSFFTLPNLTTLCLSNCRLPREFWNLPSLLTLDLDVALPLDVDHIFSKFVNLQNLKLFVRSLPMQRDDYIISCPQLLNLTISSSNVFYFNGNIVVLAPRLRTFTSLGIFSFTLGVPELENVYIKLQGWFEDMRCEYKEKNYLRFANMLLGLGNAKNVSFDSGAIEALSAISNFLASFPSPFYNLKRVKLQCAYEESSISSALRSYLLGGSPRATIVTTFSQDNMIPQTAAGSMTAQNEVIQEPLASATRELVDCQHINKTVCFNTADMVQEHQVVGNSVVEAIKIRYNDSLNEGTSNNQGISSGMWRGHEVNSEFICLLDNIMLRYPETFEHFSIKSKKLCTMNLNMLCTSLNDFTKISMTEVDSKMIVEYKDVYAYLQSQGLDVSWVVNRLNCIEQLRFSKPLITELHAIDCCISDAKSKVQDMQACVDDAKTKLKDVQTLRIEKLTEIEKAFGTMGTKLAVGFIGDDLLSVP